MVMIGVSWPLFADIDVGGDIVAPVITGLSIALIVGLTTVLIRLVVKINASGRTLDAVVKELNVNTEATRAIARSLDTHTTELDLHLAEAKRRDDLVGRLAAENAELRLELAGALTRIAVLESHVDVRRPRLESDKKE